MVEWHVGDLAHKNPVPLILRGSHLEQVKHPVPLSPDEKLAVK